MSQTQINGGTQIQANTVTSSQVNSSIIVAGGGNAFTGDQSLGSHKITNLATPVSSTDGATKGYVDTLVQGLSGKYSALASTNTETLTIASGTVTTITGTTVDGKSPAINDYVLIMNAPASTGAAGGTTLSTQPGNGLYLVTANTTNLSVSRAANMSGAVLPMGAYVFVAEGTTWGGGGFVVTTPTSNSAFTYGTNNIAFTQFTGAGEISVGSGLTKSGNTLDRAALTGDVTASAGSNSTTIASGAVTLSKIASAAFNTTPTASTLAEWDANKNLSANAFLSGFATQAASATTLTLTVASAEIQAITTNASQTQLITLPTTSVPAGARWTVINLSTQTVTVQSSGANTVTTLPGSASAPFSAVVFTAVAATPTTAANWMYAAYAVGSGSGTVTSVSVTTANGFQGTVATSTSTPAITIQTSLGAGIIKSNGSNAITSAATSDIVAGLVTRETPSGTINGSNTSFTLANTPVSGTEMLFLNGVLQDAGAGNDYTISGATITMLSAPLSGDKLRATYWH